MSLRRGIVWGLALSLVAWLLLAALIVAGIKVAHGWDTDTTTSSTTTTTSSTTTTTTLPPIVKHPPNTPDTTTVPASSTTAAPPIPVSPAFTG